jgi:hypothetical protein
MLYASPAPSPENGNRSVSKTLCSAVFLRIPDKVQKRRNPDYFILILTIDYTETIKSFLYSNQLNITFTFVHEHSAELVYKFIWE